MATPNMRDDDSWYSPPFDTGPGGYKMRLRVYANGYGIGAGTHVSVYVCLMRGEHDDQLKWPFQSGIVIQLLNQKRDQEHIVKLLCFIDDDESTARVTSSGKGIGLGFSQFIAHTRVESTTRTTQYLQSDCLKWRAMVCYVKM